jgi:hypothetical protein
MDNATSQGDLRGTEPVKWSAASNVSDRTNTRSIYCLLAMKWSQTWYERGHRDYCSANDRKAS